MTNEWPEDLIEAELPWKQFSPRSQKILKGLGVSTLKSFWDTDWNSVEYWQLGKKSRDELKRQRAAMGETLEEVRFWIDNLVLEKSQDKVFFSNSTSSVPAELSDILLVLDNLGVRARGILEREGIWDVGRFLAINFDKMQARQLGEKARLEIKTIQAEVRTRLEHSQIASGSTEELETLRFPWAQSVAQPKSLLLPAEVDIRWSRENVLDLPNLWPSIVRATVGRDSERTYHVLARRFNLDGRGQHTLNDIGSALGLARERVRQIESSALKELRLFFGEDERHGYAKQIHPALRTEVNLLREAFQNIGFPLSDSRLWTIIEDRYGMKLDGFQRPFLVLLMKLIGIEPFQVTPSDVLRGFPTVWLDDLGDKEVITTIANRVSRLLYGEGLTLSLFDVLIDVNRELSTSGRKTDVAVLRRVLSLCPGLEEVSEDIYQTRFEELTTVVLQIERIMWEWAVMDKLYASVAEIKQELNRRRAIVGQLVNSSMSSVSGACSRSTAMDNIGKSGNWALKENAGETRPLHELIEEALLVLDRPATSDEVTQYVMARRLASPHSIPALLGQHHKFQRVARGLYGLRSWT